MAHGGQNNNNNRVPSPTPPSSSDITSSENNLNSFPTDSIHSPFFIHNGDHLSLALVSYILTSLNYNTRSRAMSMALAKNKLAFVDGTLPQPPTEDPTTSIWSRCNSMVTSWLINAVSKEIDDSILYLNTAQAVWSDLDDRFHQSNAP